MDKNKKLILIIIAVGFLVYVNAFFNGFVWDDEELIINNTHIRSIVNFPSFFSGSTFYSGGQEKGLSGLYYKPLMTAFFSLLYAFFGPRPFFFHFFQLFVHIANAVLVFLIFNTLFKKSVLSFLLSLIFLVHPINAEAVVYSADLQDVLFFFFGGSAFYLFMTQKAAWPLFFLSSFLLLSSLLSKETGIAVVLIIGLYLFFFQKEKLKSFFPAVGLTLFTYSFLRFFIAGIFFNKHGLTAISVMPLSARLINIPKIIFFYLKTFFWPKDLAINQQWVVKNLNFSDFYFPMAANLLFFGLLFYLGIKLWQQKKEIFDLFLFFFLWFVLSLGLHLQVFPLDLTVSDRWFYLPQVGLLGIFGIFLSRFPKRLSRFLFFGFAVIILLLASRTFIRTFDWRNGYTLYSRDVKVSQDAFDLENNLGVELFRKEQFEQAKTHFEKSIKLSPSWWTSYNNLGAYYERKGNLEKAEELYKKSIANGNYYLGYENLSFVLLREKKYEEALKFLEKSLPFFPNNIKLTLALVLVYQKNGDWEKALVFAKRLYQLSPVSQNWQLLNQVLNRQRLDF